MRYTYINDTASLLLLYINIYFNFRLYESLDLWWHFEPHIGFYLICEIIIHVKIEKKTKTNTTYEVKDSIAVYISDTAYMQKEKKKLGKLLLGCFLDTASSGSSSDFTLLKKTRSLKGQKQIKTQFHRGVLQDTKAFSQTLIQSYCQSGLIRIW